MPESKGMEDLKGAEQMRDVEKRTEGMENGRQYRCTLSECGCRSCSCQDEFMEKERIISNIEDAVAVNGLEIIGGGKDSIIVREGSMDRDFEIRVSQLAG